MKKEVLTAWQLAERVNVGDKVFIEAEVEDVNTAGGQSIKLNFGNWIYSSEKLTIITEDTTQPQQPRLETGQYWHHPVDGDEWLVLEEVKNGRFKNKCTKSSHGIEIGHIDTNNIGDFVNDGYILGRHPDNIQPTEEPTDLYPDGKEWKTIAECNLQAGDEIEWMNNAGQILREMIERVDSDFVYFSDGGVMRLDYNKKCFRNLRRAEQPTKWEPKEGELVWVKFLKQPFTFFCMSENSHISTPLVGHNEVDAFPVPLSEVEEYKCQDRKSIDFSQKDQWIQCDGIICKTTGYYDDDEFTCNYIAGTTENDLQPISNDWQPCTPEQMQLIEKLQATLK